MNIWLLSGTLKQDAERHGNFVKLVVTNRGWRNKQETREDITVAWIAKPETKLNYFTAGQHVSCVGYGTGEKGALRLVTSSRPEINFSERKGKVTNNEQREPGQDAAPTDDIPF
jgi:hypothetical protein